MSLLSSLSSRTMLRRTSISPYLPLRYFLSTSTTGTPSPLKDSKRLLEKPEYIRCSWLKSIVNEIIPHTMSVLNTRNVLSVENLAASVCYCTPLPQEGAATTIDGKQPIAKRIDDSWVEVLLPFSGDENLRHSLVKSDGITMRYGKLFEILDGLAADVAIRHCSGNDEVSKRTIGVVTASVSRMILLNPISLKNDLKMHAYLTYVGKSSMEVSQPPPI